MKGSGIFVVGGRGAPDRFRRRHDVESRSTLKGPKDVCNIVFDATTRSRGKWDHGEDPHPAPPGSRRSKSVPSQRPLNALVEIDRPSPIKQSACTRRVRNERGAPRDRLVQAGRGDPSQTAGDDVNYFADGMSFAGTQVQHEWRRPVQQGEASEGFDGVVNVGKVSNGFPIPHFDPRLAETLAKNLRDEVRGRLPRTVGVEVPSDGAVRWRGMFYACLLRRLLRPRIRLRPEQLVTLVNREIMCRTVVSGGGDEHVAGSLERGVQDVFRPLHVDLPCPLRIVAASAWIGNRC